VTIDGTADGNITSYPSSQEGPTTIQTQKQDDYWLVSDVTVGGGNNLALRVDTISSNLIMMQTQYEQSDAGHGTNSTGQIGPLLPLIYECSNRSFPYTLDTDFFSMDGITAATQAIFKVPDTVLYDNSVSSFDGIIPGSSSRSPSS
jgi:hypothetical protein